MFVPGPGQSVVGVGRASPHGSSTSIWSRPPLLMHLNSRRGRRLARSKACPGRGGMLKRQHLFIFGRHGSKRSGCLSVLLPAHWVLPITFHVCFASPSQRVRESHLRPDETVDFDCAWQSFCTLNTTLINPFFPSSHSRWRRQNRHGTTAARFHCQARRPCSSCSDCSAR